MLPLLVWWRIGFTLVPSLQTITLVISFFCLDSSSCNWEDNSIHLGSIFLKSESNFSVEDSLISPLSETIIFLISSIILCGPESLLLIDKVVGSLSDIEIRSLPILCLWLLLKWILNSKRSPFLELEFLLKSKMAEWFFPNWGSNAHADLGSLSIAAEIGRFFWN